MATLTYTKQNGYQVPNLRMDERENEPQTLGRFGRAREQYLMVRLTAKGYGGEKSLRHTAFIVKLPTFLNSAFLDSICPRHPESCPIWDGNNYLHGPHETLPQPFGSDSSYFRYGPSGPVRVSIPTVSWQHQPAD